MIQYVVAMPSSSYGTRRERPATVSFADIEQAARQLMKSGAYPSVAAVRKELKRGSMTTIAEAMQRFWKDQAALSAGNPVALTRLPPEFADAALALWEQALRLSQQTAVHDDNAARARLEESRRDTDARARAIELREKEWDMAARVRERALAEAREQVNLLMRELSLDRMELRSRDARIADMQSQMEAQRLQLATLVARAVARRRVRAKPKSRRKTSVRPKTAPAPKKRVVSKKPRPGRKKVKR
jgi:Plasmid replication region DNA-binding N-term